MLAVIDVESGWLPDGFSSENSPWDRDEVVASISFSGEAAQARERVGGLRCFRQEPVGLIFIALLGARGSSGPGRIQIDRRESYDDDGQTRSAVWGRCGELELHAVAAGVDEYELARVVQALTVVSRPA